MKYAKSDKGYYVPKGQGGPAKPAQSTEAAPQAAVGEPVTAETSLSFKDAGYSMTKDRFGNELYIPSSDSKSGLVDYNAGKNDPLYMKAVAYKKSADGTFEPVYYDMNTQSIDESLTREAGTALSQGMRLEGGNKVKAEDVGRLLYKNASNVYQTGPMGKFVNKASQQQAVSKLAPMSPGTKFEMQ
jgi:hypothetical protein